ncbi:MAG: indole-3-glycerol phosphate synthase TrpC [Bacteroidales bacterium]
MERILREIVANKQEELKVEKVDQPIVDLLLKLTDHKYTHYSMRDALQSSPTGIIAEFKRASPSCGWIKEGAKISDIIPAYQEAGAAACSILTDNYYFGGSLDDIVEARKLCTMPILRKEFVVNEYQIYQAYLSGANAILLIASCLDKYKCIALGQLAQSMGLEVLLEVHNEGELDYLNDYVDILGVNNRNLNKMITDVQTSFRLAELMQQRSKEMERPPVLISESGLKDAAIVKELRSAGFEGFLMGETFMRTEDPAATLGKLINQLV